MSSKLLWYILLLCVAFQTKAEINGVERYEMTYGDTIRTYSIYLPANIKAGAPVVVYTHGYGSKTRNRPALNAVAEREGFAVCYPDGSPDSKGKDGWKVGYPTQSSMTVDEADFFFCLKNEICNRFNLSKENCFMTGMSNGGDLCYQLAYTAPGLFKAYASVAGLLFECTYLNYPQPKPVPFMEIHGDCDTTSRWEGDHANSDGWGQYIPVDLAVTSLAVANLCCTETHERFDNVSDSTRSIEKIVYGASPFGYDVELYKIEGGGHSWAEKDVETHELIWRFFSRYL